jgi:hypothetical protein
MMLEKTGKVKRSLCSKLSSLKIAPGRGAVKIYGPTSVPTVAKNPACFVLTNLKMKTKNDCKSGLRCSADLYKYILANQTPALFCRAHHKLPGHSWSLRFENQ